MLPPTGSNLVPHDVPWNQSKLQLALGREQWKARGNPCCPTRMAGSFVHGRARTD